MRRATPHLLILASILLATACGGPLCPVGWDYDGETNECIASVDEVMRIEDLIGPTGAFGYVKTMTASNPLPSTVQFRANVPVRIYPVDPEGWCNTEEERVARTDEQAVWAAELDPGRYCLEGEYVLSSRFDVSLGQLTEVRDR